MGKISTVIDPAFVRFIDQHPEIDATDCDSIHHVDERLRDYYGVEEHLRRRLKTPPYSTAEAKDYIYEQTNLDPVTRRELAHIIDAVAKRAGRARFELSVNNSGYVQFKPASNMMYERRGKISTYHESAVRQLRIQCPGRNGYNRRISRRQSGYSRKKREHTLSERK